MTDQPTEDGLVTLWLADHTTILLPFKDYDQFATHPWGFGAFSMDSRRETVWPWSQITRMEILNNSADYFVELAETQAGCEHEWPEGNGANCTKCGIGMSDFESAMVAQGEAVSGTMEGEGYTP